MKKSELLRSFAENDIAVFLLKSIDPEIDSPANGKMPLKPKWQTSAVPDDDELAEMVEVCELSRCGYGVLCNNLLVIDVDARNGGVESYQRLVDEFPEIQGCGLIVETGSGGGSKHLYFKLNASLRTSRPMTKDANGKRVPVYPGIDFKHSGFVVGPGSMHRSGRTYTVLSGSVEDIDDAPAALLELLKPQEYEKIEHEGESFAVTDFMLKSALESINSADDYDDWINIGMAIHHATNGDGFDIWDSWSRKSSKYDSGANLFKWGSFGKNMDRPITAGTIFKLASDNGWIRPYDEMENVVVPEAWYSWSKTKKDVTQEWSLPEDDADDEDDDDPVDAEFAREENCPVPLKEIDLRTPPGFVGDVAKWIDSQCINPRRYLAAIGAIYAVSIIGGLRHMGGNNRRSRTNMLILGVADSATGKDAIIGAVRKLVYDAGMGATIYGGIKSDKEITVNLIEHQAANYIVDEIGERLAKISNSRANGATHLDGIIGTFMEVYSKSGSYHIVGGDTQREIKREIRNRISAYQKRIDENEDENGSAAKSIEALNQRLKMDGKLDKPFLSMLGLTTPDQLKEIMTLQNVKTGFLGRAILCNEPDEFPIEREDLEIPDIPDWMRLRLMSMAGIADSDRVEYLGELTPVSYTNEADALLKGFARWQRNYARHQREEYNSPFGPLYKRMAEKATKISLVLGLEDGVVTAEHVRWGVAAAWMDARAKIDFVSQWDKELSKKSNVRQKLLDEIKKRPGNTLAKLCSVRCIRDFDRADVMAELDKMEKTNVIMIKKTTHKKTGKALARYYVS